MAIFDKNGEIVQFISGTETTIRFRADENALFAYYAYYDDGYTHKRVLWEKSADIIDVNNKISEVEKGYMLYVDINPTTDIFRDGYYTAEGEFVSNISWKTSNVKTNIQGARYYKYSGSLLGNVAGIALFDANDNFLELVTAESTNEFENVVEFFTPYNAAYLYYAYRENPYRNDDPYAVYEDVATAVDYILRGLFILYHRKTL